MNAPERTRPASLAKRVPAAKKVSAKKASAKKVSAKKVTAKKVTAKKVTAKKVTAKKVTAKKVTAKKVTAKKKPAKKKPVKKKLSKKIPPTLLIERELWEAGFEVVVGLDEVGRGSWAGPLAIGAVVLPQHSRVNGVRDSKMLSEREREALYDRLASWCRAWSVGMVSHTECDEIGMSAAQKLAAKRAIEGLGLVPDMVLIDGNWDFVSESIGPGKTRLIVKGDATCLSISTASVLAKVTRDRLMPRRRRALPDVQLRREQGLPVPEAQDGAGRPRAFDDSSSVVGIHGQHSLGDPSLDAGVDGRSAFVVRVTHPPTHHR